MLGSSRARVYIVSDKLNEMGVNSQVTRVIMRPWWNLSAERLKDFVKNFRILFSAGKDDVIYLHKTISQLDFILLVLLFRIFFGKKYYFDFDDAIFLYSQKVALKTKYLCRFAEDVIVASHFLLEYASKVNQNSFIVPMSIDTGAYLTKNYETVNSEFVVGWVGNGLAHYTNLQFLATVFKRTLSKGIKFSFVLLGTRGSKKIRNLFDSINGLHVSYPDEVNWSYSKNIEIMRTFDVGVVPLVNDDWHKGKCAFKAIEYMACGVPTIASAVGENNYLIKDGVNGFLAEDENEWFLKLKKLIQDKDLRDKLGKNGRETIENKYSYKMNIPLLLAVIAKSK